MSSNLSRVKFTLHSLIDACQLRCNIKRNVKSDIVYISMSQNIKWNGK
jgi:hypothetical protein